MSVEKGRNNHVDGKPAVTPTVTGVETSRKEKAGSRDADNETNARRLLSVKEAAMYLGVSVWTVRSLGWSGEIPEVKIGRRVLYDRQDLDRFIEGRKQ